MRFTIPLCSWKMFLENVPGKCSWKLQVDVERFKPVLRRLSGPREDPEENRFSQSSCAASRTGAASTPARDRRRLLASLQLLQQLFRFGSVGERYARAEQRLEHCLSVSGPVEPVERDGEVILDIGVLRSREARRAQVCQRLVGLALRHQNPSQCIIDLSCLRSGAKRSLRQSTRFRQITLLLIKPRHIVQRRR